MPMMDGAVLTILSLYIGFGITLATYMIVSGIYDPRLDLKALLLYSGIAVVLCGFVWPLLLIVAIKRS